MPRTWAAGAWSLVAGTGLACGLAGVRLSLFRRWACCRIPNVRAAFRGFWSWRHTAGVIDMLPPVSASPLPTAIGRLGHFPHPDPNWCIASRAMHRSCAAERTPRMNPCRLFPRDFASLARLRYCPRSLDAARTPCRVTLTAAMQQNWHGRCEAVSSTQLRRPGGGPHTRLLNPTAIASGTAGERPHS